MRGRMPRQLQRDCLDSLDRAALEISGSEFDFHIRADFLPAGSADLRIDAAIGDDLDVAVGQQQIDQHAVIVGGVPDPQSRKNIQRALPRRLIPKQRRAIQRAFHDEAELAGMAALARLDRLFDPSQYLRPENPPYPPPMLQQMPADAPDAHATSSYQLPDAPPPPKLPPPPPPPLEPLDLLPEHHPPLPTHPPYPRPHT